MMQIRFGDKEPRTKMPRSKEGIQNKTKDQRKNSKNKKSQGRPNSGTLEIYYLEFIWLFVFF